MIRNNRIWLCAAFLLGVLSSSLRAQSQGSEWKQKADTQLENKNYTEARYAYLKAYEAFAATKESESAGACAAKVSELYHRENLYKEAFDVLRTADQAIAQIESEKKKASPQSHYPITKERVRMYMKLKNVTRVEEQLSRLEELAKQAGGDSLGNDLLYTRATYYYTFGPQNKGDEAFNRLIGKYKIRKEYDQVSNCYRTLIELARKAGNATMTAKAYDRLMAWNDSVNALKANDELALLKQKQEEQQRTIEEKESSISSKQYIIIALCILAAILAAALALCGLVLMRYILLTRRQKKVIATANEHNELKTKFIQNISAQMEPTLQTLPAHLPGVKALHSFSDHIQELSALESSLSEPYESKEKNISTFCEEVADKVRGHLKADVVLTVNAPKLSAKISPEALEQVLLHLLNNAATYTPEGGKIWLDFKKRGAHTHQFVVSDTGCGIAQEKQQQLFKPFSEVKDLTEGDGLGLPICALMATKMNGSLSIDSTYTKGTRFILELHN